MMKKFVFFVVWIQCLTLSLLWGQNSMTIHGQIFDETGTPLIGANIYISGTSTGTSTDLNGAFQLEIPADTKSLICSYIGYVPLEIAPEEDMMITLQPDATQINEIVVEAQKPTLLITAEKTTIFPSMSPTTSSGNAYSVLKNIPGIILNSDGTLYLNGKSGVKILVDGKDSYLSGTDLVNYLMSMPASSLNKIELIHHPSAKYDAAGNAGIIDIYTQKVHAEGYHLNVNTNYEQGKLGRSNHNLVLGYHRNRLNLNGMYGYYKGKDYVDLTITRRFPKTATDPEIRFDQDSYRKQDNRSHYFNFGIDFSVNPETTVGMNVRGDIAKRIENGTLNSLFYTLTSSNDSTIRSRTDNEQGRENFTSTLYFQHKIDSLGKEISASTNGLHYSINETQFHNDKVSKPSGASAESGSQSLKKGTIKMVSGRVDMAYPFHDKWRLDAGIKSDIVDIHNRSDYRKKEEVEWINDPKLSTTFFYKENINAFYISSNIKSDVVTAEIGVRVENTNIKTEVVSQSYTHLFPTLSLSWQTADYHALNLHYDRRIDRPNYRDLNPFVYVFDSYTYEQGNIDLKPQLTDRLNLSCTIRKAYKIALFYTRTQQAIIKSYSIQPGTKRAIVMPTNMSSYRSYGIEGDAGRISFADWFQTSIHTELVQNHYKWKEHDVEMENKDLTFQIGIQNRIRLPWGWSGEVSGFYNSRMAFGQIDVLPIFQISGGIRKNFFDGNATLSLFSNDWFHSNRTRVKGIINGGRATTDEYNDHTIFGISFTFRYKRGSDTKKSNNNKEFDTKRISL
jgi:vitamin B12 transporter